MNPSQSFFKTPKARVAFLKSLDHAKFVTQVLGKRSDRHHHVRQGDDPRWRRQAGIAFDANVLKSYAATLPSGTAMTIGYANGNVNAQSMAKIVVAHLQTIGLKATAQGYETATVFGWFNDPPSGPDAFIDGNNGPDGGNPYMWGHVFWDESGGINYFGCDVPDVNKMLNAAVTTGDIALFVKAGDLYWATGAS